MLRLALMGDLHYPRLEPENRLLIQARDTFFNTYLDSFFRIKADYHLSIGDLTHNGYEDEYRYVYQQAQLRGVNFRQVLGNHDVLALPKKQIASIIETPLYGAVETEDALLLFLDTTKELELHGWGLDPVQWVWLEEQLRRAEHKPMLIFAHHPVPGTTAASPPGTAALLPYQDLRMLLRRRASGGVFFNGHTHLHSIAAKDRWHYVQTAASLCDPCFRVVEIAAGEVEIKTVPAEAAAAQSSGRYLHDQLPGFHRPAQLPLGETDLSYTVTTA